MSRVDVDVIVRMNAIMAGMKDQRALFLDAQRTFFAEIERVKTLHEPAIAIIRDQLMAAEKDLLALAKKYRDTLFGDDGERVDLAHGPVLRTIERHVARVKGMIGKLEMLGRTDLIKIAKSPDWDAIEKMDDASLAAIGTRRERKERYGYELI